MYGSTGDQKIKAKGDSMVAELANCQRKLGAGGYLSAFPTEWFDRLDARKRVWAPYYTVHKIMAGMFDMYQFAETSKRCRCWRGCRAGSIRGRRPNPKSTCRTF